MLDTKRIFKL